jgi:DNA-binding NarL/FixJ family response regulator
MPAGQHPLQLSASSAVFPQGMSNCVRILIAEQQPLVRGGLRHLLGSQAGFKVVGVVGPPAEAARLLTQAAPDVILLGIGSTTEPPLAALRDLHAVAPAVPILLMGGTTAPVTPMLVAGARGLLRATAGPDELFKAVRTVVSGQYWFGREAFDEVVSHLKKPAPSGTRGTRDGSGLTPRERQVAAGVARGESNREIAFRLGLSEATVKEHLTAIFGRLGLANRAELSAWATRRGIDDEPPRGAKDSESSR